MKNKKSNETPSVKVRLSDEITSMVDSYGLTLGANRSEALRYLILMGLTHAGISVPGRVWSEANLNKE